MIQEKQKQVKCMTCGRRFHAVSPCVKSFDTNDIAKNSINTCQNCLAYSLPFQTLDDLDYEFTVLNGNNVSEQDMDRLRQLKFNPFDTDSNIALTENNANLNHSSKINCEYYLPNDFKKVLKTKTFTSNNILSMMHLNTRSLNNKFDSFKQLLNSLIVPFQIIGLTETWLNDTNDDLYKLDTYDFVNVNRTSKCGGGVGIYIKKGIQYKIRRDLNINDENIIESAFIEIINLQKKNIIIGVIYRPPNSNFNLFENEINKILSKTDKENKICYLMGDFNIDLLKSESCDFARRFLEQLLTSSYIPLILKPTRITQHTATLIDNIFTNDTEVIDFSSNGIIFSDISDHLPVVHVRYVAAPTETIQKNEYIFKRNFNDSNTQSFINTIKSLSWEKVIYNNNEIESYNEFFNIFSATFEKNFPLTKKRKSRMKIDRCKSPWITRSIIKSVRKKNKLYKKFLCHPTTNNEHKYKQYKNKLNHIIKIAKKKYYEEQLIKNKNETKLLWIPLNEIMNKRTRKNNLLPKKFAGNNSEEMITNPHEIADKFNEYFINVGPGIAKKLPNSDRTFNEYLFNKCKNSFFIEPVTKFDVEAEIKNLNSQKSPGYDGISIKIIKTVANEISEPLSHVFNLTFLSGTIPDSLKIALVTPIFKDNETNEFKNYRPISVITCFSKILEKLMYRRLIKFIEKNKILTKHQYGFRENRSTELAIIELTDRITKAIDKGEYTYGIFLDLSKAFDTINHKILIQKLEHYGIRGIAQLWFENYLTNRKQIVKYNDVRSKEMIIKTGVPQGSILGPILFLLYINDIENSSKLLSFILFADDTTISCSNSCLRTLNNIMQTEINKVSEWLNVNKLSLNIKKTKFILFRSPNKKPKQELKLSINDENIKQVKNTIFLGIIIDECLTWNEHIDQVTKKIIRASGIIAKIRYFVNRNTLKLVYYALVYPYLTYGNLIWGNTYKTRVQKLLNIQKKIIKLMTFKSYLEHTEPMFTELGIFNIFQINDNLTAIFMFRYHHLQNLPEIFENYFFTNDQIHQHNTRNKSKLHKYFKRTNYLKYTLRSKGINLWNELEPRFKGIKNYYAFKIQIKKHFMKAHENSIL